MVDTNEKQETPQKAKTKTFHRPLAAWRRRQRWLTIMLGAAILISGMGIGFGSAMVYLGGPKTVAATDDPQPTYAAITLTRKIAAECGLSKQQADKIKSLMLKRLEALKVIRTKAMDEMLVVHRGISEDLRGVMEPSQFEDWEKRFNAERERSKFRHRPWKRPGPPHRDREGRGRYNGSGRMSEMFKRLDKDSNGELTKDEIDKTSGRFRQSLQKADLNGDGKVDRKEFETQLRRRRPSSSPGQDRRPQDRKNPSSAPAQDLSMLWL